MLINILKYVRKTLNLKTLIDLYWKLFNYSNIIYTIITIINSSFEKFNFLISPKIDGIGDIEKTMLFINSIENDIVLRKYLYFLQPHNPKDKDKKVI